MNLETLNLASDLQRSAIDDVLNTLAPYVTLKFAVKRFSDVDLPQWMHEDEAKLVCSFLNSFLGDDMKHGSRFHVLNRYPSGRLYLHLIPANNNRG